MPYTIKITKTWDKREDAVAWFEDQRRVGEIPPEAGLFLPDGVDKAQRGIPASELLIRRSDDRSWGRLDKPIA